MNRICVFCLKKQHPLTLFTEETLKTCTAILQIRAKYKLSYNSVNLPLNLGDIECYHIGCYRKFTALSKKYREEFCSKPASSTVVTQKQTEHPAESPCSDPKNTVSADALDQTEEIIEQTCSESRETVSTDALDQTEEIVEPTCSELRETVSTDAPDRSAEIVEPTCSESSADAVEEDDVEELIIENSTCFVCDNERKKLNGRWQNLHTSEMNSIAAAVQLCACKIDDVEMLEKIQYKLDNKCIVKYHVACVNNYKNACNRQLEKEETNVSKQRKCYKKAYESVCTFVNNVVVLRRECCNLSRLRHMFTEQLEEEISKSGLDISPSYLAPWYLQKKLNDTFKGKIKITSVNNLKLVTPATGVNIEDIDIELLQITDVIESAALLLRKTILEIEKRQLSTNITTKNIIDGECPEIPTFLTDFYCLLLTGQRTRNKVTDARSRLIQSFSEDVIYAVTNARIKTSKHLTLGIAIKSLTSSRKILDILNRYGHCCSYTVVEEMETEATFNSTDQSQICPDDINKKSGLCTGLAFNNFDRYVETLTGKNTLHDTVGIIFQNIDNEQLDSETSSNVESSTEPSRKRKRRTFDAITADLQPYQKKPKFVEVLHVLPDEDTQLIPSSLNTHQRIRLAWILSHALQIQNTPMWVGFNSLLFIDTYVKQKISYLTTINSSPTSNHVVAETMRQSQKVALECNEEYMQVTYDLAISKIALQIQSTERDKPTNFNNLFIHFGAFHIQMAYFKAIGKYVDNSGILNILLDSELLANGSLNGFLTGKHFNRCKRIHPLMSLAFSILHFERFALAENIQITESVKNYLVGFTKNRTIVPTIDHVELLSIIEKYEEYSAKTLNGEHGKTAQYYMIYINLINHYLMLTASIRTNDFELFKYVLPKITNIFFVFNQQNYARWLVLYHNNLCRVEDTHPGLNVQLERGSFGVKRTDKPFSRIPIDLTLEQTINADAASRLTGVLHFTNSISARQRWCKSHSMRSTVISHVLQQAGLRMNQDVTADLEKNRIKKSASQLQNFMNVVNQNMNPFDHRIDENLLFNISSGKSASEAATKCLLNVEHDGDRLRKAFISGCNEANTRFEATILKNKIVTFTDSLKKKQVNVNGKIQEVRMQRDLFGRLLAVSVEQNIDLGKVLSYPLTPVPFSLCHLDGTHCKTDKSSLMKTLEISIDNEPPAYTDVVLIDGFFFLHLMKDVPLTFGNISKKLLQSIVKFNAQTIAIIFDKYSTPSIKDCEHALRDTSDKRDFNISGPEQKRTTDFSKELRNLKLKEAFVKFIIDHWANNELAPYLGIKTVQINFDKCYQYKVIDREIVKTVLEDFSCTTHEEADTKIIFHVCNIVTDSNILIRCSDTDILVIMLGNMENLVSSSKIWMEVGTGNHQRMIDVTKLAEELGQPLCNALPGLHAFSGCDYNPAFYRKGKKKPLQLLRQSLDLQNTFADLAYTTENNKSAVFEKIQQFVCTLYGFKKLKSVNEARLVMFSKTYKSSNDVNDSFQFKVKNIDGSSMPPCEAELLKQFLRATYITNIWRNANCKITTRLSPIDHGWKVIDNSYEFDWFEGDQLPQLINDVVIQPLQENSDNQSETNSEVSELDISDDESETHEFDNSEDELENEEID